MSWWWSMEYAGRGYFLAECGECPWTYTGGLSETQEAAVKHVRTAHA